MLCDSFFEQGVTHEVCEDYARHGDDWAVIADGCSNGGGPRIDTDWGARLLCVSAAQNLTLPPLDFVFGTARTAGIRYDSLSPLIPPEAMCATLALVRQFDNAFQAILIGDGIAGGRMRSGKWFIHSVEFASGAPYYLQYHMFNQNEHWSELFGKSYSVRTYVGNLFDDRLPDISEEAWPTKDQREEEWRSIMGCCTRCQDWDIPYEFFGFPLDEFDFAFVASDGPHSFYLPRKTKTTKNNEPVHFLDVLRVLLDIRNFRPGFMRLQRHWNFKQDRPGTFKRRNWLNGDDVSIGAVYCG